jgi:predicted ester cyclase
MIAMGFKMFDKALPDLKEEVISIIAEGDNVSCHVIETASFSGPMELPSGIIEPTKRAYKLPVGAFFRVNTEGLIVEQHTYWDTADWERQIGIDPKLFAPKA